MYVVLCRKLCLSWRGSFVCLLLSWWQMMCCTCWWTWTSWELTALSRWFCKAAQEAVPATPSFTQTSSIGYFNHLHQSHCPICLNLSIMQLPTFLQQAKMVLSHFSISLIGKNKITLLWQLFSFRETPIRIVWYCIPGLPNCSHNEQELTCKYSLRRF